jgi:hypothetical protein
MDAKDYLDLPAVKTTNLMVDLPPKARKVYDEIERNMFAALDNGTELEVFSQSAVSNKCLQCCNGSPYLSADSDEYEKLHDAKMDALEDILEEAGGSPVLCSYSFKADAERIMKKFKKYRPVNLTAEKSSGTGNILKNWKEGKIKLLIGHPACLHPKTQVLTERRGWVNLIDVKITERVHDGVEFVSHNGCSYSGYKEVVDRFGITMTPDHKLLIDGEWEQAQNVRDCGDTKRKALYQYEGDDEYLSEMFTLRECIEDIASECTETQSDEKETLSTLYGGEVPLQDRDSHLVYMARHEESCKRPGRQELCGSWDRNVRRVGGLQPILRRHARRVSRRPNYRTGGCEQRLLEGKLHMGNNCRTTIQQTKQQSRNIPRRGNASRRTLSNLRLQQNEVTHETESRNERRRSGGVGEKFALWKKHKTSKRNPKVSTKEKVYDLVDCGPRHRFLVRNSEGEVFISHNSIGQGS